MIRDILVNLTQGTEKDVAQDFAISVASVFGAHLTGLSIAYQIEVPPFYMGALPTDFIDAQTKESEEAAKAASERFLKVATAAGIAHEGRSLVAPLGLAANTFAGLARTFDITVVAQPDPDRPGPEEVIAEAALMDSGRSILVVPYVQKTPFRPGRAVVAWDGSRPAARALAEALPLLHRCASVQILSVVKDGDEETSETLQDAVRHLGRHGLSPEVRELHVLGSDTIAGTILNELSDRGADLVVMGGYGHSRLKEMVLGGVTREFFTSMTVPVLMAH